MTWKVDGLDHAGQSIGAGVGLCLFFLLDFEEVLELLVCDRKVVVMYAATAHI